MCGEGCHGNVQGSARTQDAFCAKHQGQDPSGIKRLESSTRRAEAQRTERLNAALIDWRLTGLANGREGGRGGGGWDSASRATEVDLRVRDGQRRPKDSPLRAALLCL